MKSKFSKDIVKEAFISPSKEKTFREEVSIEIVLLISKISSAKQIFLLKRFSPIPLIARVIVENKSNNSSIKKYEINTNSKNNSFKNKLDRFFCWCISKMC